MTTLEKIECIKQLWARCDADERLEIARMFVKRYNVLIHRLMIEIGKCRAVKK